MEIITGRERRRRWSPRGKLGLVAETNEPGATIRDVAARHGVCESLLFTGRWVLPKRWAEKNLKGQEIAAKEAFEEAGVEGGIATRKVGSYRYFKPMPTGLEMPCKVDIYSMRVLRILDDWPERMQRQRFTFWQAAMAVDEGDGITLLLRLGLPNQ